MTESAIIAIPSKGRLMEKAEELFAAAGFTIERTGHARGYRGRLAGVEGVEVAFLSAGEIAHRLGDRSVHMGVTGIDLLREHIADTDEKIDLVKRLNFGHADVVVAVPECWFDVDTMADLDVVSERFYERHKRRMRVATKYLNVTRRFFNRKGVTGYRTVDSLGATEGAPAAGVAELIVDITSTGSTLKANNLKILDDGLILRSEACLSVIKGDELMAGPLGDVITKLS
ncbi:MAG: ATP phosphoribosyltransferase [Pseudomonadota bacterium]